MGFLKRKMNTVALYLIFCIEFELFCDEESSKEKFKKWVLTAPNMEHYGDCTKQNISCERCTYERLILELEELRRNLQNVF